MNEELLHAYLTDHLSNSTDAIDLANKCKAGCTLPDLAAFLDRFVRELRADQRTMKAIRSRLRGRQRLIADCLAWIVDQTHSLRFGLDYFRNDDLGRLEQLEALLFSIRARVGLWQLLANLDDPRLNEIDFSRLSRRAQRQAEAVERQRLAVAKTVFGTAEAALQLTFNGAV